MAIAAPVAGARIVTSDLAAFYNLLKGVTGSGENITLIYDAGALTFQPSANPSAGTRLVTVKNTAGTTLAAWRYDGLMELLATATAPASPVAGSVFFDTVLGGLRVSDGTTWNDAGNSVNRHSWYWQPGMSIESTLTGTGAYTAGTANGIGTFSTGATSGSNVGLRKGLGIWGPGNNGCFELRYWSFTIASDKAASEAWRIFITDESVTGQPSLTAKHLGMKFDGTTCSFSTADGATEQTTDVTAQVTANTDIHCVINFDGTTAKLFMDGTLRGTHATNVPTTAASTIPVFRAHITNSAAADKLFYITQMSAQLVA